MSLSLSGKNVSTPSLTAGKCPFSVESETGKGVPAAWRESKPGLETVSIVASKWSVQPRVRVFLLHYSVEGRQNMLHCILQNVAITVSVIDREFITSAKKFANSYEFSDIKIICKNSYKIR